ncbi:MAG: transcriptional regulator [Candidatus Firestonebacteria bacterium RIFOXYC2_FULL_39_67]|nr:MAG: transcriptional regulator [Candidatus Firestonebacteria bacterium RIFOXYD2_FULL_39_29]OGF55024.1 MAG: transcriptional regulator [Candidatus Firestonebacteria bacterium RIFOXYC2_FULL_39_67]
MDWRESEILEFKKSTSELKEAVISISAILNKHQEGELYFGIKNDGEIVGQAIGSATARDISQAISNHIEPKIYPSIETVNIKGKSCIKIEFKGEDIPYHAYGRVYIRVADEDKQLSPGEIRKVILKKSSDKFKWEFQFSECSSKEINAKIVRDYLKRANLAGRINFKYDNAPNVLKKLGLVKGSKILNAGQVLFSKDNSLELQVAVFAGVDKITFLDINQYKDNIFNLLKRSEEYLKEKMNWRAKTEGLQRQEIPEVPIDAIREALVNSFCHRDYVAPESNKIAIFKNRIEIWNPGDFPEGFTPMDFIKKEEQSILRNPLIADILYKSKEIEKWGSGLKKIYNLCKENNIKVDFKILKAGFMVIFYRQGWESERDVSGQTTQKTTQKTTQNILAFIRQNPTVTRKELAALVGNITEDGIKYHLAALIKNKTIKRVGGDKGGHWEVLY